LHDALGSKRHFNQAILAMMKKASITEAKNNLSALIDSVNGGSPVLIVDRRTAGGPTRPGNDFDFGHRVDDASQVTTRSWPIASTECCRRRAVRDRRV
jgi:hypothetical protein